MHPLTLKRQITEKPQFCSQISDFKVATRSLGIQCMSWSSPKTDLETNFLNLENRNFEYVTFSQL